jgi:hypothetical protein
MSADAPKGDASRPGRKGILKSRRVCGRTIAVPSPKKKTAPLGSFLSLIRASQAIGPLRDDSLVLQEGVKIILAIDDAERRVGI